MRVENAPSRRALLTVFATVSSLAMVVVTVVSLGWTPAGRMPTAMQAMASQQLSPSYTQPTQIPSAMIAPAAQEVTAVRSAVVSEPQALDALTRDAADTHRRVTLRGQWAAQMASKYVGIVDPQQSTVSGSHTFAAPDIWAEHLALEERTTDATVLLFDSRTFGDHKAFRGQPYWMTIAVSERFTSQAEVLAWCQEQFPSLSGTQLNNRCLATQLRP